MSAETPFAAVPPELDFPRYEREILELWRREHVFRRSIEQRPADGPSFTFYEGPPTANGVPHNGHVLTRVMKDLFPRYQAMRGKRVLRKAGWDTHGLPVEVEVEKELGIHGKAAIEAYGVEPFVQRCIESVFRYTSEWERLTERIGFWVDLPEAYVTFHQSYVESVWWALAKLFEKGLLYQGHKVVWWWAQGGTALSSGEVGQGYKTVDDPSAYVAFPLVDRPERALVVWTTTPWTLPSNGYVAVRPDTDYVAVRLGAPRPQKGKAPRDLALGAVRELIVAAALREALADRIGHELEVVETLPSSALAGQRYVPPFDVYSRERWALSGTPSEGGEVAAWWRVLVEDFVDLKAGTGVVHLAPAFGEDDARAHERQLRRYTNASAIELRCAVNPDGSFRPEVGRGWVGRWVKDCDKEILGDLRARGLLVHDELFRHEYPFCWRSDDDPLIQLARPAWFIRTTALLDRAKANNQAVDWLPPHIKDGRFGDFLDNNVDWALSRERYWGTPLNVWSCEACGKREAPSSVAELERRNPDAFAHWHASKRENPALDDHLKVHKPWIDHVSYPCAACGAAMRRVPEVIDCWFDSGCMPFAQWGFPHGEGSRARFDAAFPADFISEAIDQTRGWFYSLLMISSLVFDETTQAELFARVRALPHPYARCIVLGHVCDRDGKKESKSRGNYTPPDIILDRVSMDFAVLAEVKGVSAEPGTALIGRDDLQGMDLEEGAVVRLARPDRAERGEIVKLLVHPALPRRVIVPSAATRATLELEISDKGIATRPVEVPELPAWQRLSVTDEGTPAPGADAFRWFFYASSPPWNNTRHSLQNVRLYQKDYLVRLRNVYAFFVIYANIDGWSPARPEHAARPHAERALLDRWIAAELSATTSRVTSALDDFQVYDAALALAELVDALSNWWLRRSRSRFWAAGLAQDKKDALATLHEALVTISRLTAPFTPFFAEELHQNLVRRPGVGKDSVHLEDWPAPAPEREDAALAREMRAVREVVSLGLSVRAEARLKVRQPLARADVVLNDGGLAEALERHRALILDELNVNELSVMVQRHDQGAIGFKLKPNFRALGPRLGKQVQAAKLALEALDGARAFAELGSRGAVEVEIAGERLLLGPEELEVGVTAAPGFAAATGKSGVVVLHTSLTEELRDQGLFRELLSRVQAERKEQKLGFSERIVLELGGSERFERVARAGVAQLESECLASRIEWSADAQGDTEIEGERARVVVRRAG